MKYLFIGCVDLSLKLISYLVGCNTNIVGVITKKDNGYNADYADLGLICGERDIDCLYCDDINSITCVDFILSHKPDIGLCFGWNQLLSDRTINLFPKGVIGHHPSELPFNRGHHPVIWAIALGLDHIASSFFVLDSGADTGDIVSQETIAIDYKDEAKDVYLKIEEVSQNQLKTIIFQIENNALIREKQNKEIGNTWRRRGHSDGIIDWRMSSRSIYNLVRALTHPYVGASFLYKGKEIKVWRVQEIQQDHTIKNLEPGRVLRVYEDGRADIKTYDGIIRLIDFEQIDGLSEGDCLPI